MPSCLHCSLQVVEVDGAALADMIMNGVPHLCFYEQGCSEPYTLDLELHKSDDGKLRMSGFRFKLGKNRLVATSSSGSSMVLAQSVALAGTFSTFT